MSNKIDKFCKKCEIITTHRKVNDKRGPYYSCANCLDNNSKKHRKKCWQAYLSQKANGRKRKDSTKLTKDDIKHLDMIQEGKCALSGVSYDVQNPLLRPSLDRIDNNIGYTKNNIQLVTWIVNRSRGALSIDEFKNMCKQVAEYND